MQGRNIFLDHIKDCVNQIIKDIEEREAIEPDFAVLRELAEQLNDEIAFLQDC